MKKNNIKRTSLIVALAGLGSVATLTGCGPKTPTQQVFYSFSIGMQSGASIVQVGAEDEYISVYDNGVDTNGRNYVFSSTDEDVATIDQSGKITFLAPGSVNFVVTETNSGDSKQLRSEIRVVAQANNSNGGYNYAGGSRTEELNERAKILGQLEKYAMDTHLTGITLFDNGGKVKYASRVKLPVDEYIVGYGYGILTEGRLEGELSGEDGGKNYPSYYHSAFSQDPAKINQYTATGSQVSDLAGYITSTYWGTRLKQGEVDYEWYPVLATDEVYRPTVLGTNTDGSLNIQYAATKSINREPIPMEKANDLGLYRKWRVYVKTDGDVNGSVLKYHTKSTKRAAFDNRGVTIDDYEFIYKMLFTGSNGIIRGTEMANDSSYGIKGAQRYFNESKGITASDKINEKWNEYVNGKKIGIQKGVDQNGAYLDIELINAIDSFTAMYTLSSSLTSPLPEDFFMGSNAIFPTMKEAANKYGTANNGGENAILDYTLCLGAYQLEKWAVDSEIVFQRNDDWFDYRRPDGTFTGRYNIPGVYNRKIDTSTDTEKNWKQFVAGNLDSAGVPSSKVEEQKGQDGVKDTKGDSTFKLNVNSCTQDEWEELFGPEGKFPAEQHYDCKPWMSNDNFLDGLFYAIDRKSFAEKRGVTPSINYFSDAYMMRNAEGGISYNETEYHKAAVEGYETFDSNGNSDYGYNYDKAVDCFRAAVNELSDSGDLVLGTREKPTEISINIQWMYTTDEKEYGEDIASYFTKAFNDDAVCGGKVKLVINQAADTNWENVYNVYMMQGRFDLGFGAISGNTYNPLNFLEVLKSDNSSGFTLNWGTDTSKVDEVNPIIYDGKKWSFDALWEVADHGGIVANGEKVKALHYAYSRTPRTLDGSSIQRNLYEGYQLTIPVEFEEFSGADANSVEFGFSRLDLYVFGRGNITLSEDAACYDKANKQIVVTVSQELAQEIQQAIIDQNGFKDTDKDEWHKNPFINSKLGELFSYELYYTINIGGTVSEVYAPVETNNE